MEIKTNKPQIPESVSVKEFAEAFGLNRDYQYQRIKKGELPHFKVGGLYRIPLSYVQELAGKAQIEQRVT